MDIYFIRHGQTSANQAKRYQAPNEPITDHGSRDVAKLVRTIQELEPTHLYTSPYKRARQTADYISYATELPAEWLEIVHELEYPDSMLGKRHFSLATVWYGIRWFLNLNSIYKMPGAESRPHFFLRLMAARQHFENNHQSEDRIVVVTHSFFINGFVMHMCREKPMQLWQALPHLFRVLRAKNTGVTHVRYQMTDGQCSWSLVTLDEGSHLEE